MVDRNEKGQFIKGHNIGFRIANANWWKGKTRSFSKERAIKLSAKLKGRHCSPSTEFKKGCVPSNPFPLGHLPWNTGLKRPESTKIKISEGNKRSYALGLKIPCGYAGGIKHKKLVKAITKLFESASSKVEIEKPFKIEQNRYRVVDVLVDDIIAIEVGRTTIGSKLRDLEHLGLAVINIPYSIQYRSKHHRFSLKRTEKKP